jgi:hypothetical protein
VAPLRGPIRVSDIQFLPHRQLNDELVTEVHHPLLLMTNKMIVYVADLRPATHSVELGDGDL